MLDAIFVSMKQFVDIEELSRETGFPVRTLRSFVQAKKIPVIKLGHRTMRFNSPKVIKALMGFEIPAVNAK